MMTENFFFEGIGVGGAAYLTMHKTKYILPQGQTLVFEDWNRYCIRNEDYKEELIILSVDLWHPNFLAECRRAIRAIFPTGKEGRVLR
jgi:hypothetical protein